MQPKRKEGICLTTNPVLKDRASSNVISSGGGGDNLSNCRQSCDFTTFKGNHQSEATNNFQEVTLEPKCHGIQAKQALSNIFQVVPLNDLQQVSQNARFPIEPIDFKAMHLKEEASEAKPPKEPFKFAGFLSAILTSFICSISILCLKLLPVEDTIGEKAKAVMIRGIFMMIFSSITIIYQGYSFLPGKGEFVINFARAILGATNIFMIYVAIKFITMGECSALVYSSPIWTCILAFFILKEPLPASLLLAIPMSLLGIILLAHPDLLVDTTEEVADGLHLNHTGLALNRSSHHQSSLDSIEQSITNTNSVNVTDLITTPSEEDILEETELYFDHRLPGIVLALVGSVMLAIIIIILKFRKETPIVTCSFYLGAAMLGLSAGVQAIIGFGALPVTLLEWTLHICIGVLSHATQVLFQWSLQYVPAGSYSVVRSLDIVLGFILGAVFLGDVVLWTSVVGSILIMLVVALLMLNDHFEAALRWLCSFWRCCSR